MSGRCIVDATVLPMTTPEARADAIAWHDGRILAVGDRDTVVAAAATHGIEPESRPGRIVTPGFVDAHMHLMHVGVRRQRPDLRGADSLASALARVKAWLADHPDRADTPVIAEAWDETHWPEGRAPTRTDLDAVREAPLVLRRIDGHIAVGNTAAVALALPKWGPERVDADTGVLLEEASLYLNEVMPVDDAQADAAVRSAARVAHQLGVTCVGTYEQAPLRAAWMRAAEADALPLRVSCNIYTQDLDVALAAGFETGRPHGGASSLLRDGGLKVFLDGSFGGRTAAVFEPYRDENGEPTDERGMLNWSDAQTVDWFARAHKANVQIHAHAIGDRAIEQGLDAFEALAHGPDRTTGAADVDQVAPDDDPVGARLRHRFEHYEIPHDHQRRRTRELGITVCAQPNFVGEWSAPGGMYERRLGEVFRLNNRYRDWLDEGVTVSFGSDGMPFGPLYGIHAALSHPIEEQRIRADEAIWLYTAAAARACHWEDMTGTLAPGKAADVLIIDAGPDAFDGAGADRPATEWIIEETLLDGETMCTADAPHPFDP